MQIEGADDEFHVTIVSSGICYRQNTNRSTELCHREYRVSPQGLLTLPVTVEQTNILAILPRNQGYFALEKKKLVWFNVQSASLFSWNRPPTDKQVFVINENTLVWIIGGDKGWRVYKPDNAEPVDVLKPPVQIKHVFAYDSLTGNLLVRLQTNEVASVALSGSMGTALVAMTNTQKGHRVDVLKLGSQHIAALSNGLIVNWSEGRLLPIGETVPDSHAQWVFLGSILQNKPAQNPVAIEEDEKKNVATKKKKDEKPQFSKRLDRPPTSLVIVDGDQVIEIPDDDDDAVFETKRAMVQEEEEEEEDSDAVVIEEDNIETKLKEEDQKFTNMAEAMRDIANRGVPVQASPKFSVLAPMTFSFDEEAGDAYMKYDPNEKPILAIPKSSAPLPSDFKVVLPYYYRGDTHPKYWGIAVGNTEHVDFFLPPGIQPRLGLLRVIARAVGQDEVKVHGYDLLPYPPFEGVKETWTFIAETLIPTLRDTASSKRKETGLRHKLFSQLKLRGSLV